MMSQELIDDMTKWLVSRQTLMLEEEEHVLAMTEDETPSPVSIPTGGTVFPPRFHAQGVIPLSGADAPHHEPHQEPANMEILPEDIQWVGVNGRCHKVADTCYTFWVGGTLGVCYNVSLVPTGFSELSDPPAC